MGYIEIHNEFKVRRVNSFIMLQKYMQFTIRYLIKEIKKKLVK